MTLSSQPTVIRVITWLPVGGIERRLVAVVPRLQTKGWNMRVVCIREEGPLAATLREAGVPVDMIKCKSRLAPSGLIALRNHFKEHQAQIVHSHMYRSNIPATIGARLAGVPVILGQVHNVDSWDNRRQIIQDRLVSRFRKGTLAVSRAVQQDVMEQLGLPEDKVPILYNGIDTTEFIPNGEDRRRIRQELSIPEGRLVYMVPARLHPQKNPGGVIAGFRAMLEKLSQGGSEQEKPLLLFVGGGKMEGELASQADDTIRFLGQRDDMKALYNAADVILLSSFREGFSNAVVEALACGKPVIASDVGGNKEAVNSEAVGWIHPPSNHDALAAQLVEAHQRGQAGLAAMATDCRARAEVFSLEALINNTDALYRRLLGRGPQ